MSTPMEFVDDTANREEFIEDKKAILDNKLQKREEERGIAAKKRKDEKDKAVVITESADFFLEKFNSTKTGIELALLCKDVETSNLIEHFDSISASLHTLKSFFAESSSFLKNFDLRKAQASLNELEQDLQEKRDDLLPKKKFVFRSKKKAAANNEQPYKQSVLVTHSDHTDVDLADCKFVDKHGEILTKDEQDINQKDVALARLQDCTVYLHGAPSAIHINKLENVKVFSGPVGGSIFITECKNCVFVLACQQLRIHTSSDCQFYIHVTSRGIIEDCRGMMFAPFNWSYPNIQQHFSLSGLDQNSNNWDDIDDFNWLASDKASPNWTLIADNDRVKSW